jgi:hypothetical protein
MSEDKKLVLPDSANEAVKQVIDEMNDAGLEHYIRGYCNNPKIKGAITKRKLEKAGIVLVLDHQNGYQYLTQKGQQVSPFVYLAPEGSDPAPENIDPT